MRHAIPIVVLGLALGAPAVAHPATTEVWEVPSRHVDVKTARLGFSADTDNGFKRTPRDGLHVAVRLPAGYDGRRRFPILYLFHPYSWSYDYWLEEEGGNIDEHAAGFPGIIVMPEGARGFGVDWFNGGRRADPAWESFVLDEVIPLAESRLRIRPGRRWRAVAGFSMGGMTAVKAAIRRPDYFGTTASLSGEISILDPALAGVITAGEALYTPLAGDPDPVPATSEDLLGDYNAQRFYWEGHDPLTLVENLRDVRVFATVGDGSPRDERDRAAASEDAASGGERAIRESNREFAAAARAVPLRDFTYSEHPGTHSDYAAGMELAEAIAWGLFEKPPPRPSAWVHRTIRTAGRAWRHGFRFSEPPTELATFRGRPGRLAAEGSGTVAITTGGCTFSARLPFSRSLPACRMSMAIRPRRVRAGRRTRILVRLTDREGRPVRGAVVRVGQRRARTGSRGRARVRYGSGRARAVRVRATRTGFARESVRLAVLPRRR